MRARSSRPRRPPLPPRTTDAAARPIDPLDLAHLWAGQFQHLTTLGVAGAGGLLVLLQVEVMDVTRKWWLSLLLFALTAVFSLYGQVTVVDDASTGSAPGRKPRTLRALALTCLGAVAGAALGIAR
jgi:hypothetical protein